MDEKNAAKVMLVTMSLNIGGAETHVIELAKALSRKGASPVVVSAGGEYVRELMEAGITHIYAPLGNKNPRNMMKAYGIIRKTVIENDIKIVHAHARIPAFICGFLCRRLGIRLVTTAHGVFRASFPYRLLSDWGCAALAVSGDIKEYLIKNYKFDSNRIFITINGIDANKFAPSPSLADEIISEFSLVSGKKRIVNVVRMDKGNCLAAKTLCKAAPEIYRRMDGQAEIILIGGGDDFDDVLRLAREANAAIGEETVKVTGNRTDVASFLGIADIFVGISRSALEAMSAGLPVILAGDPGYIGVFDESRLADAVESNFTCRGFPQIDLAAFTDDVCGLLGRDGGELRALGVYGRKVILENYSADKMADDALMLYDVASRPVKRYDAVISGYYGSKNHGDDALLHAIIGGLRGERKNIRLAVLSRKPKETERLHGVKSVNKFNFIGIMRLLKNTNLLISGGGTLVQDVTSTRSLLYYLLVMNMAVKYGAKVMIYASGVGPLRLEKNRRRAAGTLKKAELITLRDELSMQTLKDLGVSDVPVVVTADAVFGLKYQDSARAAELLPPELAGSKYFCVAVRSWKYLKNDFEDTIRRFADYIGEKYGLAALFIPMQRSEDSGISMRILSGTKKKSYFLDKDCSAEELSMIIGGAEFVLGMRLHTIIYAAKTGVPAIALSYDPKVTGAMEAFSLKYCVDVRELDFETIKGFADEITARRGEISQNLAAASAALEKKALETVKMAIAIIERKEI